MSASAAPIKNPHVYAAECITARRYYAGMQERRYMYSRGEIVGRIAEHERSTHRMTDCRLAWLHTLQEILAGKLAAEAFAGAATIQNAERVITEQYGSAPAKCSDCVEELA